MIDLKQRSTDLEIMDDLDCHGEVVDQTLRELETINRLLGGDYVTIRGIARLLKGTPKDKVVTIADCGCGGGDLAVKIVQWGKKNGYSIRVEGIDANPHIIEFAKKNTASTPEVSYQVLDVFSDDFRKREYDIVVATLFVHHFSSDQLVGLFHSMSRQARRGVVINDIHRHPFAYHSIRLLTRYFSRSAMVKFDAPLSVRRAFIRGDLEDIMSKAKINKYTLRWLWAFRWQLIFWQ